MDIPSNYLIFKINILKKMSALILGVFLAAFLFRQQDFAFGFIVGGLLSLAVFSLLYKYVLALRAISVPRQRKAFVISRSLLIYLIMGAALLIGIKKGVPSFLGVAAGILSLKIAIFIQGFQEKHASG